MWIGQKTENSRDLKFFKQSMFDSTPCVLYLDFVEFTEHGLCDVIFC